MPRLKMSTASKRGLQCKKWNTEVREACPQFQARIDGSSWSAKPTAKPARFFWTDKQRLPSAEDETTLYSVIVFDEALSYEKGS